MTTLAVQKPSVTRKIVLGVLGLLVVLGLATGAYRLAVGLGNSTNLSDAYPWGLWIAFDFSLIAFGGVGFTLAAIVHILGLHEYRRIGRAAVLVGLLSYAAVLVILLVDLGRPDRFWGFLVFWNLHSPLFEISWCVLLYTTVLVLEFAPDLFVRLNKPAVAKAIHSICIPVVFAAVILSTLHQSTLGTLYLAMPDRLHPLWYSPLLPHLFYISSIGQGLATAILVWLIGSKIFGRKQVEVNLLDGLAKASIWVWVLYLVLKFGDLLFQGKLGMVFAFDRASIWFDIEVIVGVVAPVVLFALPNVRQSQGGLFWTSILVTLGTFLSRFNATLTGQMVVEGATYSPHWMEHAIQVGVLAAAVIAWYLLSDYLALFKDGGAAAEH